MRNQFETTTPEPADKKRALKHVQLSVRRDWAGGVPGFESAHRFAVDPNPLIIYDINGSPLFYEFTLQDDSAEVGVVRASATRLTGSPIVATQLGKRRWDQTAATKAATEKFRKLYQRKKVLGTAFVCYSYPKVAVRVDFHDNGEERSKLFDVSDLSEISQYGADELEGETSWSFLESLELKCKEKSLERWALQEKELDIVSERFKSVFNTAFTARELPKLKDSLVIRSPLDYIPFFSSRVLEYGPRCSPHDCFMLYAQQTNVFCAVATGQMLLDFHRWPYTQAQIADAMNTGPGGTNNPDQVAGYESLTNDSFVATYDTTANWSEAKAEIDANRPLKSGIPGHARACAGWKRQNIHFVAQPAKRWLQIYDPWPWNENLCEGGQVVWEDWDAVEHTNFIYLRHA